LLGLLVLATALLLVGRSDPTANPSVTNYGPSGLAAWAELLRRDGYQVRIERDPTPAFEQDDVLIAVAVTGRGFDVLSGPVTPRTQATTQAITQHLEEGGVGLFTIVPYNFEEATKIAENPTELTRKGKPTKRVSTSAGTNALEVPFSWMPTDLVTAGATYSTWTSTAGDYDHIIPTGKGRTLYFDDGMAITNRFLDQFDNAEVSLDLFRSVAPPGSKVVFVEAYFGNVQDEGWIDSLGPWASAARTQALILAGVIILTLGVRFGSPLYERQKTRGTRELVDAVADVFRRSNKQGFALELLYDDAMERIRVAMKRPVGTKRKDLLEAMPESLREACLNVGEASVSKIKRDQAVKIATRLLDEMERFEKDSRGSRVR